MKLKSIRKISSEVRYIIRVFEGKRFVEDFKMDYIVMTNDEMREVLINKYFKYENNRVRNIDTEVHDGKSYLCITIDL